MSPDEDPYSGQTDNRGSGMDSRGSETDNRGSGTDSRGSETDNRGSGTDSRGSETDNRNDIRIREATIEELPDVCNVLDGGLLSLDIDVLKRQIEDDSVLVAVDCGSQQERILGVLVVRDSEIVAVAVRRRRRGQGIGTRLVSAATEWQTDLVAEFDERVRPFWESVGDTIEPVEEAGRYRCRL